MRRLGWAAVFAVAAVTAPLAGQLPSARADSLLDPPPPTPFDRGHVGGSIVAGELNAFSHNYIAVGAGISYFVLDGLAVGLAAVHDFGDPPSINEVTPSLEYVAQPLIGRSRSCRTPARSTTTGSSATASPTSTPSARAPGCCISRAARCSASAWPTSTPSRRATAAATRCIPTSRSASRSDPRTGWPRNSWAHPAYAIQETMMMRSKLATAVMIVLSAACGEPSAEQAAFADNAPHPIRAVKPSEAELRKELSPVQYEVTQHADTEPPFHNAYWNNHAAGLYVDITTGQPLFTSNEKFESGTGWPSFYRPIAADAVIEKHDGALDMERTEVRSRIGDAHLGHVFDDGPQPTGLRYCINSASLRFVPVDQLDAQGYAKYKLLFGAIAPKAAPAAKAAPATAQAAPAH